MNSRKLARAEAGAVKLVKAAGREAHLAQNLGFVATSEASTSKPGLAAQGSES